MLLRFFPFLYINMYICYKLIRFLYMKYNIFIYVPYILQILLYFSIKSTTFVNNYLFTITLLHVTVFPDYPQGVSYKAY